MRWLLNFMVLLAVGAGVFALLHFGFLGGPQVKLQREFDRAMIDAKASASLGGNLAWRLLFDRPGQVCAVTVELHQAERRATLFELSRSGLKDGTSLRLTDYTPVLPKLGFQEGPAVLQVIEEDCSMFRRRGQRKQSVVLDFTAPQITLTSSQHYVNQGGADVATYTTSSDAVWSGVRVGPNRFRGYPQPGGGGNFAFFVFSYELPPETPITLVAMDEAGNETTASLVPSRFFPKEFRHREIPIDDRFISTKVMDIISQTPELHDQGDSLKNFLQVNRDLRIKDNDFLRQLAAKSAAQFFWHDAFQPLGNAAIEASFADYRAYLYQGAKVDEQVHLGFDMAVTEHYPIQASGRGQVAFAGYLGIYGNTIVIDHGYGLMTLYGHLSAIDVHVGDMVERAQKIGNSGATGLAAGDHLHFSMLIDGVQTNPIEFWDQHWIDDHVTLRIRTKTPGD